MVKHLVTLPCFIGPSSLPAPRFPASRLVSDYAQARQAQAQAGTGGHRLAQAGTGWHRLRQAQSLVTDSLQACKLRVESAAGVICVT